MERDIQALKCLSGSGSCHNLQPDVLQRCQKCCVKGVGGGGVLGVLGVGWGVRAARAARALRRHVEVATKAKRDFFIFFFLWICFVSFVVCLTFCLHAHKRAGAQQVGQLHRARKSENTADLSADVCLTPPPIYTAKLQGVKNNHYMDTRWFDGKDSIRLLFLFSHCNFVFVF